MFTTRSYFIAGGIGLALLAGIFYWSGKSGSVKKGNDPPATSQEAKEHKNSRVELSPETLKAANIEIARAEQRETSASITVTGAVEANQQKIQQVTPLVAGRIEGVNVVLGDRVRVGAVLALISSPAVAEMHGNLHEAETRLRLALQTLDRVQRSENRAGVIQSKAKLDEAEATLRRTRRLIELGAAAGKDLTSAESGYASAKAEYDFQSNISINREVQEARSAVETAQSEVGHLRNSLSSVGASIPENETSPTTHNTSTVTLLAPIAGTVTERMVNAGAGVESGKPIFTIADISTLWVIANVPEGQISALHVGTPAEISHPEPGAQAMTGRVAYIDPILNEVTRTGRVRVEIANPGERLKVGMFVNVRFQTPTTKSDKITETMVIVPDEAVQRIGDRSVVFIPVSDKAGQFEVRDVDLGETMNGVHLIRGGLRAGENVVTKGSFVLKTQLLKAQLGEQ